MKILWVEDFENKTTNAYRAGKTKEFFGEFVAGIKDKLDRLEKSKDTDPNNFINVLADNSDSIWWRDGFLSGLQTIVGDNSDGPFDFVVLDAHLPLEDTPLLSKSDISETTRLAIEHFETKRIMPDEDIHAGFRLYFFLVEQSGYEIDKIVFLSAHADQAEDIKEYFKIVKASPPSIFVKKAGTDMKEFVNLLKIYSNDKYIILRRSVYDGCAHLLNNISSYPFRFNEFIDGRRQKFGEAEIRAYLENLQSFLAHRVSLFGQKQKGPHLNAFIRVLLHQWDDKARWQNMYAQTDGDREAQSISKIVKNVRNWSAHSNLFEDADEKLATFLFLVNMRVMFALPDDILSYERQALRLYSEPLNADEMAGIIDKREIPLARTYEKIKKLSVKSYRDSIYFENMLANLGKFNKIEELIRGRQIRESISTLIFRMFWHVLSPAKLSNVKLAPDNRRGGENVGVWYRFDLCDYGKESENSFIFQLARHIYKESF